MSITVLTITAEAAPICQTGGLGDVAGTLPAALSKSDTNLVMYTVMPWHGNLVFDHIKNMRYIGSAAIPMSWHSPKANFYELDNPATGTPTFLVGNDHFFGSRTGLFGFDDDAERYAFFCRACLELLRFLPGKVDILHCHDWHCSLVPLYLKHFYREDPLYTRVKTIYTIHNQQHAGTAPREILFKIGLDDRFYNDQELKFYHGICFAKSGMNDCDRLTTVSPTNAKDLATEAYGFRLDGVARANIHKLSGILNGIDIEKTYNPMNDTGVFTPFNANDLRGKKQNRRALHEELNFPIKNKRPLISLVSRLAHGQKGIELIISKLEELAKLDAQWLILGTGEPEFEYRLRNWAENHPKNVSVNIKFNVALSQKVYAASDMVMVPSYFEPCGLVQMISCRFGSLPVVRRVGGLADTIKHLHNGFVFDEYSGDAMVQTLKEAIAIYRKDEDKWLELVKNAMKDSENFCWTKNGALEQYRKMYEELVRE